MINQLDWSLVQAFLSVAETGSLSAAARELGASQPTLGRQIKQIETQLGATLFRRQPRGFTLTETGAALVAPARAMREATQQMALIAAGQQEALQGSVRITASTATSCYHMPSIIAAIRTAEPEIEIELVPSDDTRNLLYREADIAVRMYRPTQLDLITQHIGDITLGVFAAQSYIDRRGMPERGALMHHDFVGFDTNPAILDGMQQAGFEVDRTFFGVRCDDNIAYWELVRAGCGIGFAQACVGRADPSVRELDFGYPLPALPIWLTAHEAMRQTPRIRRVWDLLSEGLKPLVS
ncbi:transcriptional regulator, LysR family [Cognatiyoonia koreensis]|uniref:Transcriptional regulator, LysR family n=1 Tax=Cognatiyoonia koreensis TaxID=364200 RepID=A0A1I0RX70_9RHOB|nr:LysR family transcriptional regulator [Cognatiyoonia koreensis]SEW46033.1 transcriptional regulator, LysR family [Cognatiyoonia koreensis]